MSILAYLAPYGDSLALGVALVTVVSLIALCAPADDSDGQ